MATAQYRVVRRNTPPQQNEAWDGPFWASVPVLEVSNFHPKSTEHHPRTRVKLAHTGDAVHTYFRVNDQYVISRHQGLHAPVSNDSCVEFFFRPKPDKGYFNFEVNCGGSLLVFYIENHKRTPEGFEKFTKLSPELANKVKIETTMPKVIEKEIAEPVEWSLRYTIPLDILEHHAGPVRPLSGQTWRGNFYKCASECSKPHWATWSPIGEQLNFHLPEYFGELTFE